MAVRYRSQRGARRASPAPTGRVARDRPRGRDRARGRRRGRGRAAPHRGPDRARQAARPRAGDRRAEIPRRDCPTPSWPGCSGSASRTPARCCIARWKSSGRPVMPLLDQDPIDPEIAATLDAIDATLAGEPVDGRYAEIAEIALLLASDRPEIPPAFAQSLDGKVERRFAPLGAPAEATEAELVARLAGGGRSRRCRGGGGRGGRVRRAAAAASSGASSSSASESVTSAASSAASSPPASSVPAPPRSGTAKSLSSAGAAASSYGSVASGTASTPSATSSTPSGSVAPAAPQDAAAADDRPQGRPGRAAQPDRGPEPDRRRGAGDLQRRRSGERDRRELERHAGRTRRQRQLPAQRAERDAGADPDPLSSLNYAQVVSRTDSSQDITDQYGAATRALADARALRTSLLKQLANAVTTEQIDSLKAQIHDAEASISSDQATLNRLNHQVNYSEVYVSVQAKPVPRAGHPPQWRRVHDRQGRARRRPRPDRGGRRGADRARRARRRSRWSSRSCGGSGRRSGAGAASRRSTRSDAGRQQPARGRACGMHAHNVFEQRGHDRAAAPRPGLLDAVARGARAAWRRWRCRAGSRPARSCSRRATRAAPATSCAPAGRARSASIRTAARSRWLTSAPGDIFGEMAMLDGERRSATVESIEGTEAIAILERGHAPAAPRVSGHLGEADRRARSPPARDQRAARPPVVPDRAEPGGRRAGGAGRRPLARRAAPRAMW